MDCSLRFSLPLDLSPVAPHIPPVGATSLSLCTRFPPPPPLSRLVAERPPTWTALPPACLHRSCALPSHSGWTKRVTHASHACRPLSSFPPCRPQPVPRSLSTPGFSRPRVPSPLCLSPSPSRHPPPFRPLPAAQSPSSTGWLCHVLRSPVPCTSASPYPCSAPSLGVF